MAEGINDGLRESSDLLGAILDNLKKAGSAVDSLPGKIKSVTKSLKEASSGFSDLSKSADGVASASSGAGGKMPWLRNLKFGATPPAGSDKKVAGASFGGGAGGTGQQAAAGSGGPSPKQVAFTVGAGMAGMGAALWSGTPGVADAVTRQAGLFPMAFSTPGFVDSEKIDATNQRLRSLLGPNLSGIYDDLAAANLTRYAGFGMNTREFDSNMRTAGSMFALTGMSNQAGMQAMVGMQSGQTGARLASVGIFTHDLRTGDPRDIGAIVDEMWVKGGWEGKDISLEEFEAELAGGFLGADLRRLFGDNPPLYQSIVEAFRLKVKAKGRSGIRWNAKEDDPNSAIAVAKEFGLSDLAPQRVLGETNETRRNNLDSASEGLYSGFQASENIIQGFNEALSQATDALGPFADLMYGLKGGFQDFSASGEGASMIQMATTMMGMVMPGLKMFMADGGSTSGAVNSIRGNSTSDSVPAMLSRGEYVINARSASMLGHDYLDRLNSVGQDFGSAFTLPVRHFSSGGVVEHGFTKHTIDQCTDGACAGQATLDGWTALAYGDPALKKYSIAGSSTGLVFLERDGIGQYLANFAAAWQADPALGGGRLNLNQGWSGGHALRASAGSPGASNHSAGVAMDLRADVLPAFNQMDMTSQEIDAVRALLNRFPKLEWGGDWGGGMLDEMHFEIRDPGTWGTGGHVGAEAEEQKTEEASSTASQTPRVAGVMASVPGGGGPESLMNPMLAAQGISARWAKAFSLAPHGTRGNLLSTIAHSLFPGMLAGGALTLFGGAAAMMTSVGQTGVGANEESASEGEDSSIDYSVSASGGSGAEWLYQFLVAKGARGALLQQLWTIAMRESGGNPNLVAAMDRGRFNYPDVPDDFNPDSESWRGGRYDVGLFQINSQHIGTVKSKFGGDMLSMVDPNKNFEMMGALSGEFKNWKPWGISGFSKDGISYIDWSTWGSNWAGPGGWGAITEERTNEFWNQFQKYNTEGYSKGAWRTKDEVARIHDGEMIIPANAAEEFRKMMREAVSGGRSGGGDVHINLTIARASEEEAMRFAKTVQRILKDDERIDTMRSR